MGYGKRVLRLLTALVFCLSLMPFSAWAADEAALTVSSAAAEPGETVTLTLSLTDNPGYAAYNLTVDFDESRLEMTDFQLASTGGALSMASAATHAATYASLKEKTDDGALATMTFRVRDDAPVGSASVSLKDVGFFRADESRIAVTIAAGSIGIGGEVPEVPSGPDEEVAPAQPGAAAQPSDPAEPEPVESSGPAPAAEELPGEEDGPAASAPQPEVSAREEIDESGLSVQETTAEISPQAQSREGIDRTRTIVYEIAREEGIPSSFFGFETVTVPYPDGVTGETRAYRAYMVSEDGDLEELPLTETAAGLSVVTDPERPVAVAWDEAEEEISAAPLMPEAAADGVPDSPFSAIEASSPARETEPERSAGGIVAAAAVGAVIGAAAVAAILLWVRRKRD